MLMVMNIKRLLNETKLINKKINLKNEIEKLKIEIILIF